MPANNQKLSRIWNQCRKESAQFCCDRLTLALAFVLPVATLFIQESRTCPPNPLHLSKGYPGGERLSSSRALRPHSPKGARGVAIGARINEIFSNCVSPTFVGIAIGILLATTSRSQQQAQLRSFFVNLPLIQLSGAIAPISAPVLIEPPASPWGDRSRYAAEGQRL